MTACGTVRPGFSRGAPYPVNQDDIKGTSGIPEGLSPGAGSAGTAMKGWGRAIQFPVPQGERGMLQIWHGQFCLLPPPVCRYRGAYLP